MGFESDVREYHRRAGRRPDENDSNRGSRREAQAGNFQPRQMRVKKEEPEIDFKTRMKNLTKVSLF